MTTKAFPIQPTGQGDFSALMEITNRPPIVFTRGEGMYLYVDRTRGLKDVPEILLQSFGEPAEVMTLVLTPERKLARVDVEQVLASIRNRGFFLQMPPASGISGDGRHAP